MDVGSAYVVNCDLWLVDENDKLFWSDNEPDGDFAYVSKNSILLFCFLSVDNDHVFVCIEPGFYQTCETVEFNISEVNEFMTKIR